MIDELNCVSVSDVNNYLKQSMMRDENLHGLLVRGEISNLTDHARLGHLYFTLKDDQSSIRAVMFKGSRGSLTFHPENGMKVILQGDVRVYERDGILQLVAYDLLPDGIGALQVAFEQLRQKLEKEGLFSPEHKKPIPTMPKRIGIITAKGGAALQDILNILSRRYPLVTAVVIDSLVQGKNAPESLMAALEKCDSLALDTIIIGRGGGPIEDLWCFNDERLARAIYACQIPIISAVGHEIDFTIADFVADLRAPTPSAAAELATPDQAALETQVRLSLDRMNRALSTVLESDGRRLEAAAATLYALSPSGMIQQRSKLLSELASRLQNRMMLDKQEREHRFMNAVKTLGALNPLSVLERGYSITFDEEKRPITSVSGLTEGDLLQTKLKQGHITSKIMKIEEQ